MSKIKKKQSRTCLSFITVEKEIETRLLILNTTNYVNK